MYESLELKITNSVRNIILPVLIVIGFFLNILSFFVMKRIDSTALSFYFSILSLLDTSKSKYFLYYSGKRYLILGIILTGGINLWTSSVFNWSILDSSTITCKLFTFAISSMLELSVVIIIVITVEKLQAVLYPLRASQNKYNKKRSIMIVSVATFFCFILNGHFLFSLSINQIDSITNKTITDLKICTHDKWFKFYDEYWPFIDAIMYSFLPFILITFFNILISRSLIRESKKRLELQQINLLGISPTLVKSENFKRFKTISIKHRLKHENMSDNCKLNINGNLNNSENLSKQFIKKNSEQENMKTDLSLKNINETEVNNNENSQGFKRRKAIVEYNSKNIIVQMALVVKNRQKKVSQNFTIGMIVLLNTSFCVLTMPIVILQIIHVNVRDQMSDEILIFDYNMTNSMNIHSKISKEKNLDLIKSIFELLQYLNHCINFFLFCLKTKRFRDKAKFLLNKVFRS